MKVYWLSRHDLSPAQISAVKALHGVDAKVVKDAFVFDGVDALREYVEAHNDGFVYAVAAGPHYIAAALAGASFGMFENHPGKRADGAFGLANVYHVEDGKILKVWVNPDPSKDEGEALVPVAR